MDKNTIEQFINTGIKIREKGRQSHRDLAASGIADLSGNMPADMHEWMSSIKIYITRNLSSNHPLYNDINLVLFHSKNKNKDYEKMMGLLKALSQDTELFENNDSPKEARPQERTITNVMSNKLPQNSRTLLKEIVESGNATQMICERFRKCSAKEDEELRSLLRELSDKGYIKIPLWADNVPYSIQINNSARNYSEKETEYRQMLESVGNLKRIKEYDVFISHANKDKSDYVDNLFSIIKKLGINIFYDSDTISWGDNWKDIILNGTEKSEFAIIVISESFFGREWTERELSEFLQRQNEAKQKIVLPLLHNITFEQLKERYPALEYIQSIKSLEHSSEDIAIFLAKELIKRYK